MTPFVRVSTIEAYRRVLQTEYTTEAELIETVRNGQSVPAPRWQMLAGTAWHRILERPEVYCDQLDDRIKPTDRCECDGYQFLVGDVDKALALRGPGRCEVTATRTIDTPAGPVTVKGTADHVSGLCLRDAKCKFSGADAKDYEPSLQWRLYLWLFGAARFTYDLFEFRDPDDRGFCAFKGVTSFSLWAYPGLDRECRAWAGDFLAWATARGLTRHLTGPAARPEAVPA